MRITTVFNKLLSLQGTLVRQVEFLTADSVLYVTVRRRARRHRCPLCSFSTGAAYDHHTATWRHVALGRWAVFVRARVCRLSCPRHGVVTEAVPWAGYQARFTLDFEDLVAWCAREMNKTAVTHLLHIAWQTVGRIIERVVERKLDVARLDRLYVIGVDEISYRKGHKYLTVVADHRRGTVAWMGDGRSRDTLGAFFDELGPERSESVALASMDMCAPYIAAVRERAKNAEIVFDPFHVVKLGGDAVHKVRRTEARERKGTPHAAVLKGSRWALLKAPESLKPDEEVHLAEVAKLNKRVYRAYLLKEELRAMYLCGARTAAKHLRSWLAWASRSKLAPFVTLAATLRKYRDGVLAAIRYRLSNGRLEGLNNKIRVISHRAYGFHSAAALMAMVYLCCGGLSVELPT